MTELYELGAVDLLELLAAGEVSCREATTAILDRIDTVNPAMNAIVSARPRDDVLADASARDAAVAAGERQGPLQGLPIAVKDLADVAGMPTRAGSLVTSELPVTGDSLFVERLRAAGVVFVGKTNTPEFGTGSHTFNQVFGVTRNPHDLTRSTGGSSGGAAAAVAAGALPVADGSDLGGSLRNPAAFCGVVGFRPSIGRVPRLPDRISFHPRLGVEGPIARSVADAAQLLSVMAGPDARDPRSLAGSGSAFARPVPADLATVRVGWGGDLGLFPVDAEVMVAVEAAMSALTGAGARVEAAHPDLSGAPETFRTLRALVYRDLGEQIPPHRHRDLKNTVQWNIAAGRALTAADVLEAERVRTRIHLRIVDFFERYDVLALPTTQVSPFPVEIEYPTEVGGQVMNDYLEWMASCYVITVTGCPAVSVPAGPDGTGLPVGLQLVAAPGADLRLLEVAAAVEPVVEPRPPSPIDPRRS